MLKARLFGRSVIKADSQSAATRELDREELDLVQIGRLAEVFVETHQFVDLPVDRLVRRNGPVPTIWRFMPCPCASSGSATFFGTITLPGWLTR